jgi:hypothetical protein
MKFFKPSDIVTVPCSVSHITRTGSAFAVDENEESVYIPVRLVEQARIDIGDSLTCYCIDQSLDENQNDASGSARYRVIRMKVEQRLNDILPGSAASDALVGNRANDLEAKPPKAVTLEDARTSINEMFSKSRAWTITQIIVELRGFYPGMVVTDEMCARITSWIEKMHEIGTLASCKVAKSANDESPDVWYAAQHETFLDLINEIELED